ncbi:Protein of unknown function [Marininema mesophilum]|uniref:DUF2487 domain-containing protein n=1 Tax=Marininema mesophilum TaxID=1048340 RepID=A0A1H2UTQ1_9BACL|nr:DUF2487 family protein [Marininema mesophilum]SDW59507.1 Protein of unknown function [Marininema mesophilum]
MRLTRLERDEWKRTAPFVDTLLIPVYRIGITNKNPDLTEAKGTEKLARLVEEELTGRLLLMPAICYGSAKEENFLRYVKDVGKQLRNSGFHHCFLMGNDEISLDLEGTGCGWIPLHTPDSPEVEDTVASVIGQITGVWESI